MNVPQAEFIPAARSAPPELSFLARLFDNRNFLGLLFMLPAALLLLVFLTYPLGLGTYLGFTDAKVGRPGVWIGIENYEFLMTDSVFRLSVWNTFLYTFIASAAKFVLGLWLALLLNEHIPFKAFIRAIVLLPFIVPTVLSAIAFWWIYDAQFSVISWLLTKIGVIHTYINFLGEPNLARMSVIIANIWRGVPFVAICLLAGLQTISPSLYEAAAIDGANGRQTFLRVIVPAMKPINVTIIVVTVMESLRAFDMVYVLSGNNGSKQGLELLSLLITNNTVGESPRPGYGSALATVLLVVSMAAIVTFLVQNFRKERQA